ncbi:hypothetical protein H2199_006333 [Coniosporium tulheliwenetii]|uniref:Uncharacterized protein n=1 Tax=Coniosporium tulheliwenetii TaxID=3383036 RepID=A0ACC2YXG1_9PEZI|nr:hypothetical protein H2199_006333 [Cladosporium sp. JES 115]
MHELADLDNLPPGVRFSEAALNILPPERVAKCRKSGMGMGKAGLFPDDALEHMEQTLKKHKEESRRFAEMLSEIKAEDLPKEVKEKEVEAAVDVQSEQSFRMPFINKALTGGQSPPLKVSRLSALILQLSRGIIPDDHPELVTLAKKFAAKCIEGSPEWMHEIIRTEAGRQTKILTIIDIMGFAVTTNNMEEWERLHRHLTISFEWGKTRNELMGKYGAPRKN